MEDYQIILFLLTSFLSSVTFSFVFTYVYVNLLLRKNFIILKNSTYSNQIYRPTVTGPQI